MNYPIHLGVTEAGDGIDGRIKSGLGIGSLLEDGIGDTIRVSLTEEPEAEIPVCLELVKRYANHTIESPPGRGVPIAIRAGWVDEDSDYDIPYDPFDYNRRQTHEVDKIGHHHVPVVILSLDAKEFSQPADLKELGYTYIPELDKWNIGDTAPDYIYLADSDLPFKLPGTLKKIFDYDFWKNLRTTDAAESFPLFDGNNYLNAEKLSGRINLVKLSSDELTDEMLNALSGDSHCVLILHSDTQDTVIEFRKAFIRLINRGVSAPVILHMRYDNPTEEQLMLYSSTDIGSLLIDGFGDGIWIESPLLGGVSRCPSGRGGSNLQPATFNLGLINNISFTILQAARTRISRTEYIACPSCGRTQFDLQETTSMIRAKTSHLKGLKIAVMGCIVNGPGEMADADYGFVGSGPGWVTLYRGKEVIERGIPYEKALGKLIELVKEDGNWLNPL